MSPFGPGIVCEFSHVAPDGAKVYQSNAIVVIAEFCETTASQRKSPAQEACPVEKISGVPEAME
jgi:hypothetical protein